MEWLNYHHLLYFWTVVREGGVSRAAEKLRLAQPTVSAQVKLLEDTLGQPLFDRQGRRLVLTDTGRVVYRYADEIFGIGRELMERALASCAEHWPGGVVELGAQAHLTGFYASLGFETVGEPYDEDGIPHVWMRRE